MSSDVMLSYSSLLSTDYCFWGAYAPKMTLQLRADDHYLPSYSSQLHALIAGCACLKYRFFKFLTSSSSVYSHSSGLFTYCNIGL